MRTDTKTKGRELRIQKETFTYSNGFLAGVPRALNEERIVFLTSGTGRTEYPHAEGCGWPFSSHRAQKLTESGSQSYVQELKL